LGSDRRCRHLHHAQPAPVGPRLVGGRREPADGPPRPAERAGLHPRRALHPRRPLPPRRHRRWAAAGRRRTRAGHRRCRAARRPRAPSPRGGRVTHDEPGGHTLGRWTADHARLTPTKVAVDERGLRPTYAELDARASALAERLLASGYRPGDRIATLPRNSTAHVVLFFACAKAGLVLVPLSWRLSTAELAYQLGHSRPALVAVAPELAEAARAARPPAPVVHLGEEGIERDLPAAPGTPPAPRPPQDDDPLLLVYTSGSSSRPRGVVLTHANCFWTNLSLSGAAGMTTEDVVLAVLPQHHVGGWNIQPLLAWWRGATVVLEPDFDPGRVL